MRGFPVILAAMLLTTPGLAASFDCNKAATPLEYAICGDPDLSRADEDMDRAFSAARSNLSKLGSAVVLDNQRRWIDFVSRACTEDAEPRTSGRYDEDGIACLATLFDNRARALGAIGPVGGLTVYPIDWFGAVADPNPEPWSMVATTVVSYAQLDGPGAEIRAFNSFVQAIAEPTLAPVIDGQQDDTANYDTAIGVNAVTPHLISLIIDEYFYAHGAAHGNYAITYAHFLRGAQRALVAGDVFAGSTWADELAPRVIDRLAATLAEETGETDMLWEELDGLEQAIADPARWDIQPDGIAFQFQPYEVTAYAYGAPKALLSWAELSPWLKKGALGLLRP